MLYDLDQTKGVINCIKIWISRCPTDFDIKMKVYNGLSDHNIFVRNLMHSKLLMNTLRITIGTREQMERVIKVIDTIQ